MGGAAHALPNIPMLQYSRAPVLQRSNPHSLLPPMAGLFFPAMNRLFTTADARRPRRSTPRKETKRYPPPLNRLFQAAGKEKGTF